jgi:hypothetical protein
MSLHFMNNVVAHLGLLRVDKQKPETVDDTFV